MKRSVTLIACILLLAMSISACGAEKAEGASQAPEAAETQSIETSTVSSKENESDIAQEITSDTVDSAEGTSEIDEVNAESNIITGGSTMEEAEMLQPNVRYTGSFSGDALWFSFSTGEQESTEYTITLENLTVDSDLLSAYLFDKNEEQITPTSKTYDLHRFGDETFAAADESGTAATGTINDLLPNTVYYLRIEGDTPAEYSLRITDATRSTIPVAEHKDIISESDADQSATNQDSASILELNNLYHGKYNNGYAWIAFKTNESENADYSVTLENLTVGSEILYGYLYDEYGTRLFPISKNYDLHRFGDETFVAADESGTAATGTINDLLPNTVYYLRIEGDTPVEYMLTVKDVSMNSPDNLDNSKPEGNISQGSTVIPGTSQSYALNIPLGTKVYGKYIGGHAWIAFTTTEENNTEYRVTTVNCTVGSDLLNGHLYERDGSLIQPSSKNYDLHRFGDDTFTAADASGTAATGFIDSLKPNTTYYLLLEGDSDAEYSILITSSSASQSDALITSNSIEKSRGALDEHMALYTGTNQNIATLLKLNVEYNGHYKDGYSWVAFTTTDEEQIEYSVTLENLTAGSEMLYGYLYNEYGTRLLPVSKNYDLHRSGDETTVAAGEDGRAATGTIDSLTPNTTYYVRIEGGSEADYMIMIGAPEPEAPEVIEEPVEEEVVFEVPFELNETQVRFVANEAIFIDEDAAKAALAPVAEIILAHPDHPILLAGTTAEWGSQESCVDLSNRRAAAVKDLLVNNFGVPESQLITVGLGYADDPFVRGRDNDSNGNFIETEGAKNRRVVVLDAESDIARQILGN